MDVVIASNRDSEELWAEISFEDTYSAEVKYDQQQDIFVAIIYAPPDGADRYLFPLSELEEALGRARHRLVELGYGNVPRGEDSDEGVSS